MSSCGKVFAGGEFSSVLFGTPLVKCTLGFERIRDGILGYRNY